MLAVADVHQCGYDNIFNVPLKPDVEGTMTEDQYDAFISYAREDFEAAQRLAADLRKSRLSVWIDQECLLGGERWEAVIRKAINTCKIFIILLSKSSVHKQGFLQEEICEALKVSAESPEKRIFILPIRIDECEPPIKNPYLMLRTIHTIDLFPAWEQGIQKVLEVFRHPEVQQIDFEIIGFDLGHGETAIAKTYLSARVEPQIIDIKGKNSIITAVAVKKANEALENDKELIAIGDEAYECSGPDSLFVLFKKPDFGNNNVRTPVVKFVNKCLDVVHSEGKISFSRDSFFFVGSPAGWSIQQRKDYERVLREAGMINVSVIPESRAAFLDAKESGTITEALANSVLIIDIGSSTTDYTVVEGFVEKPVVDFGHNKLGAGIIDIMIFNKVLNASPDAKRRKLEAIFSERPYLKARCLLKCRDVKEKYFSRSNESGWVSEPALGSEALEEETSFYVELNQSNMNEILSLPIEELDNRSWPACFHEELMSVRAKYGPPRTVLMTGGGSRMKFTQHIAKDVFPSSSLIVGLEPKLTIAKGLAYVGRIDFKVEAFRSEVYSLINSELLEITVREELPTLCGLMSKSFYEKARKIIMECFDIWQSGRVRTIYDMERRFTSEIDRFLKDEGDSFFKKDIEEWFSRLSVRLDRLAYQVCDKYGIPPAALSIYCSPYEMPLKIPDLDIAKIVGDSVAKVTAAAVAMLATAYFALIGGRGGAVFGFFLGSLVGTIFSIVMQEELADEVKGWNLPVFSREFILKRGKMNDTLDINRGKIESKVAEAIHNEFMKPDVIKDILNTIRWHLNKCADKACIYIRYR